jgi:hypothetical protein
MKARIRLPGTSTRIARALGLLALSLLSLVSSSWVADGLKGECLMEWAFGPCTNSVGMLGRAGGSLVVFAVVAALAYRGARDLLPVRTLAQNPMVRPHRALIAPISRFEPLPEQNGGKWQVTKNDVTVSLSGNLEQDIQALNAIKPYWNGQQFLRGLQPHLEAGELTHMRLIGSKAGVRASQDTLEKVGNLVKLYAPDICLVSDSNGVDYQDLRALLAAIDNNIAELVRQRVPENQIIIDVTGGQKTTSIACALATLHRPSVEFQYVESKDAKGHGSILQVISFNVVTEPRHGAS